MAGLMTTKSNWFLAAATFIVSTACLLLLAMVYLRLQAIDDAVRLNEALVHVLVEQTTRTVQTIDQKLELAANSLALMNGPDQRNAKSASALFKAQLRAEPFVTALWYADATGRIQYSSNFAATGTDLSPQEVERDFLSVFRAQPQSTFLMSNPRRSEPSNDWVFSAARPVRSGSGAVVGVLVAAVNSRYFEVLWQDIDLGVGGSISLMRREGLMMIRSPFSEKAMQQSFKDRPVFKDLIPVKPQGSYQDASAVDGIERIFSYRVLEDYPDFVIIMGQPFSQVLKVWDQWVKLVLAVWVFASVAIIALCVFLAKVWSNKEASENEVRTSEARYHALFSASIDAILLTATNGSVLAVNAATGALFGMTEEELKVRGRNGLMDLSDPRLADALAVRARTGQFQGELLFIKKNGERFVGEVFASVFAGPDGTECSTMIVRDMTQRNLAETALRENAEKVQALSRRVIEVQETERRRVAIELHDGLGQALTALKINLQSGERFKNTSSESLNAENIHIVDDVLQQMRDMAVALRPSILDNLGLIPALNWMGKKMAASAGFDFFFKPVVLKHRLPSSLETTCFRIVQEALTNVTRYAQAASVTIDMALSGNTLVISVEDDGSGFDWDVAHAAALAGLSFGVLGMMERAALVGGKLEFESIKGQGTTVTLRCPLPVSEPVPLTTSDPTTLDIA